MRQNTIDFNINTIEVNINTIDFNINTPDFNIILLISIRGDILLISL